MGDWSPETTSAKWTGEFTGPAVGARFKGTNQMGSKKWASNCTVTACEPGKRFAFDVKAGPFKVAGWACQFAATDSECLVTEQWEDHRARAHDLDITGHHGDQGPRQAQPGNDDRDLQRLAAALETT